MTNFNYTKRSSNLFLAERIVELTAFRKRIKDCKTLPDYMDTKRELMLAIIETLPLSADKCPFCDIYKFKCLACWYGKNKGICQSGISDTYAKLTQAIDKVNDAIGIYWTAEDTKKYINCNRGEKVTKGILEQCKSNLDNLVYSSIQDCDFTKGNLMEARLVSDYMRIKQGLMEDLLDTFPTTYTVCPFCMHKNQDCEKCWYGKNKGICISLTDDDEQVDPNAAYRQLEDAKKELSVQVDLYWMQDDNDKYMWEVESK